MCIDFATHIIQHPCHPHLLEITHIQLHHIMLYLHISTSSGLLIYIAYTKRTFIIVITPTLNSHYPVNIEKKPYIYLTGSSFYLLIFIPVKRQ